MERSMLKASGSMESMAALWAQNAKPQMMAVNKSMTMFFVCFMEKYLVCGLN